MADQKYYEAQKSASMTSPTKAEPEMANQVKLFDFIELDGLPKTGSDFSTDSGGLVDSHDMLVFTTKGSGQLQNGDTTVIDGTTYTVTHADNFKGNVTYDAGRGDQMSSELRGAVLELTGSNGDVIELAAPYDTGGNLPEISNISFSQVDGSGQSVISWNDLDTNEIVDLKASPATGFEYTLNDLIQVGALPGKAGDIQTTNDGGLVGVDDNAVFSTATTGTLSVGDTALINGTEYKVVETGEFKGYISHDDAKGEPVETPTYGGMVSLSDANGTVVNYVIPYDDASNLSNISQIEYAGIGTTNADLNIAEFDGDETVTLGDAAPMPTDVPIHDMILVNATATKPGEIHSVAEGDLTAVEDAIVFSMQDPTQLQLGDTAEINGMTYKVTVADVFGGTVTYDDPTTKGIDTAGIKGANLQLTDDAGNTLEFIVPFDPIGDLPNISEIQYEGFSSENSMNIDYLDTNDDVSLVGAPPPQTIEIPDMIQLSGAPTAGATQTTSSGDLIEVDEPVQFQATDPTQLNIGDTATIDGIEYTVTDVGGFRGFVNYDDPLTSGPDIREIKGMSLELTDGAGNQIDYAVPRDDSGELPNITSIQYDEIYPNDTWESTTEFVNDDTVTLGDTPPEFAVKIFDMIQIDGLPTSGQIGTTAVGDLIGVDEPIVFNTVNADTIQLGDIATIDGIEFKVTISSVFKGTVTYDDPATAGLETATVKCAIFELTDANGATVEYTVPYDQAGDLPNISQIEYVEVAPQTDLVWDKSQFDGNENVTLGEAAPVELFDLIELNSDLPLTGEVLSVNNGGLVEIDEPVAFNSNTPGEVNVGDTTVINGVTFSVSEIQVQAVDVTYNGGADNQIMKLFAIELTDGSNTFSYFAPVDNMGDFPNITSIKVLEVGNLGYTIQTTSIDNDDTVTLICFAEDTSILCKDGNVPIQDLAIGDRVLTYDNGFQTIRWIGKTTVNGMGKFAPIEIAAHALTNSEPVRLSPQHRVLINNAKAEVLFGEQEVLVAAKHLVNGGTILQKPVEKVTYYHVLFDTHELVFSNGLVSESFHPALSALNGIASETRQELMELFPEFNDEQFEYHPSARITLKAFEAPLVA